MTIEEYKEYIKSNFDESHITLNNHQIPKLTDKEGINWYPITYFFKNALNRKYKAKDFVETRIDKYMQVIIYRFPKAGYMYKTWFINETGLKIILRNIKTSFVGNIEKAYEKELLLDDACNLFNVKRKERQIIYAKINYETLTYPKWIMTCFETDTSLNKDTIWKWCRNCGRYFPNTKKYFPYHVSGHNNVITHDECKECSGKMFLSDNKDLNALKKHHDSRLIKEYQEGNFFFIMKKFVLNQKGYNLSIFNNRNRMIRFLKEIKNEPDFDSGYYFVSYIAKGLKVPYEAIRKLAEELSIPIGLKSPLEEDKQNSKRKLTQPQFERLLRRTFLCTIDKSKIKFFPGNPIMGIVTPAGLNVIFKEDIKITKINCYKYSPYINDIRHLIKVIKMQGGKK